MRQIEVNEKTGLEIETDRLQRINVGADHKG